MSDIFDRKDSGVDYRYNPEYHRFCDDLGVDRDRRDDPNLANKLSFIYDWAKDAVKDDNGIAISLGVQKLISRLGTNDRGTALVDRLFEWTRLEADGERLRIKKFEESLMAKRLNIKDDTKKKAAEAAKEVAAEADVKSPIVKEISQEVKQELNQNEPATLG